MRVDNVSTASYGLDGNSAPGTEASAPKNEFLQLLVAQLQHQDPLSPQDGAEFVAQLAQFTAVEQGAQTNKQLLELQEAYAANERVGYTQIVGKTVTAQSDSINLPMEGVTPMAHLEGTAAEVQVTVKDSNGKEVKKIDLGTKNKGDYEIAWDGTDADGKALPEGTYTFEVSAKSAGGAKVEASSRVRGVITSLDFVNGGVEFRMGSETVFPNAIVSVGVTGDANEQATEANTQPFNPADLGQFRPSGAHILGSYNNVDLVNTVYGGERTGRVW